MNRLIGYCRVSTQQQSTKIQEDILKKCGCQLIYKEKISGVKINNEIHEYDRPELNKMLNELKKGDIIVIRSVDRLGRLCYYNMKVFYEKICPKGAFLKIYNGDIIDKQQPHTIQLFLFQCMIAEAEYTAINARRTAGLLEAQRNGRYGGRLHTYKRADVQRAHYLKNKDLKVKDILKDLQVSRRTYYRMLKHDADTFQPRVSKKK